MSNDVEPDLDLIEPRYAAFGSHRSVAAGQVAPWPHQNRPSLLPWLLAFKASDDNFKELNKEVLVDWCNGWGDIYDYLNRIVLYIYPPQSELRYELYFEFDVFSKKGEKQSEAFHQGTLDYHHFPVHKKIEEFKNVYNEKPKDSNYINEWNFFCNAREATKELPKGIPSIEIYRKKTKPIITASISTGFR